MKVSYYPETDLPSGVRPAATLGNFDGLHLGHQAIMNELKARARARAQPSVVVTFEPHPISILRPGVAVQRILNPEQKQEILAGLGLDHLMIVRFTVDFSMKEPESFVREVIHEQLHAAELVLGTNFRFGRRRAGDLETLRSLGHKYHFDVLEVESALHGEKLISSSLIRGLLAEGKAEEAAAMLGRPYFVDGTVVKGDGRGRLIGYHTANLEVNGTLLLEDGVYVTSARVNDRLLAGMSHLGGRPTFGVDSRAVETHLFDFSEEIYGAPLRLYFHDRIRETVAFSEPSELRRQMGADRDRAQAFFRSPGRNLVL
jgi:riboflavin kinase/FMN adenylyltransferase